MVFFLIIILLALYKASMYFLLISYYNIIIPYLINSIYLS